MDGSLPSSSFSHSPEAPSKPTTTRSGLTLVLPSLKNLKAAKVNKKSNHTDSIPQSPAVDVEVPEKKGPRPVKLKPLKEVLTKLIQQIKKKDDYAFFLQPVDQKQVPGYLEVINRPMDLGTMTKKVSRGKYRSLEDFASDLKLVTGNAKTFNPPGTIYHTEADRIEAWALDHIAKASSTVIQYETDWNIDIERDEDTAVNIDDDDEENPPFSIPPDEIAVNGRSPSVTSQVQQTSGRRGPRGPYKKGAAPTTVSESIDSEGRLPGSKDGLGTFPPCSDWAKIMVALKLKGKRYKTKKERLRFEKEGPPYLPDGSLDYSEVEDPFSVLSALAPDPLTRPHLVPIYPPFSIPLPSSIQPTPSQTQSVSENSTPQPELGTTHASLQDLRAPTSFPSTISFPLNYDPSPSINLEVPLATTYSKRRHWHIVRNPVGRKARDNAEDFEVDEPSWQIGREAHPADFGSFAVLAGALSEEMRKRGVAPGVLKDGEEEKAVMNLIRESLDSEETSEQAASSEDAVVTAYIRGSTPAAREYFTSQRASEADEYIRDMVYGGVDGLAYVRSLAEFASVDLTEPRSIYPPSELGLGMSLGEHVQNLVDELTEGRHSLLRETAEQLRVLALNPLAKLETDSVVAVQTATSLHLAPHASIALQALLQIKLQKIDMSALISKPEELFLSEEEWAGKGLRAKRKEMQGKADSLGHKRIKIPTEDDAMDVEEEVQKPELDIGANSVTNAAEFEMEGPEELAEVLEYVADVIVELNQRVSAGSSLASDDGAADARQATPPSDTSEETDSVDEKDSVSATTKHPAPEVPEDQTLRNLRLNLLALAKRAPLDTIARLPLELVPEHIRHYIPTLDTSLVPPPAGVANPITCSPVPAVTSANGTSAGTSSVNTSS